MTSAIVYMLLIDMGNHEIYLTLQNQLEDAINNFDEDTDENVLDTCTAPKQAKKVNNYIYIRPSKVNSLVLRPARIYLNICIAHFMIK